MEWYLLLRSRKGLVFGVRKRYVFARVNGYYTFHTGTLPLPRRVPGVRRLHVRMVFFLLQLLVEPQCSYRHPSCTTYSYRGLHLRVWLCDPLLFESLINGFFRKALHITHPTSSRPRARTVVVGLNESLQFHSICNTGQHTQEAKRTSSRR